MLLIFVFLTVFLLLCCCSSNLTIKVGDVSIGTGKFVFAFNCLQFCKNRGHTVKDIQGVKLDPDEVVMKNVCFKMSDKIKKDPINKAQYEEALNDLVIREAFIAAGADRPQIFNGPKFYSDSQQYNICTAHRWYVFKYKYIDFTNITSPNSLEMVKRNKQRYYQLLEQDQNDVTKAVQDPNSRWYKKLILNK